MTDVVVETLAVHGPGAGRLARIAARSLPHALDAALSGMPDVAVDSIVVTVDVTQEVDDETLAVLWADAIRAEIASRLTVGATRGSWEQPSTVPRVSIANALHACEVWLATPHPRPPLPRAALALSRADAAAPARSPRVERVLEQLDAAVRAASQRLSERGPGEEVMTTPSPFAEAAHHTRPSTAEAATGTPQPAQSPAHEGVTERDDTGRQRTADHEPDQEEATDAVLAAVRSRLDALADLIPAEGDGLDLLHITRAAGLVLLYPWLADHCRRAIELHPDVDEAAVRTHALAVIVDPDDRSLTADPLITHLAGADPGAPPWPGTLSRHTELEALADDLLGRFASLLPGFAASSPAFVRREWIVRAGLVEMDLDPVRLTASTHPLDVVLPRLPYPLGLIQLPWSRATTVRFRP